MSVCVSRQQEFASRLHHHVAKEYVGQLMKNNYSCKNRKHEKAAGKIRKQWSELRDLFVEMVIKNSSTSPDYKNYNNKTAAVFGSW